MVKDIMSKSKNLKRARQWKYQAENDLLWAKQSFTGGFFAQSCFVAQQVAEKALKSLAMYRGFEVERGHSVKDLVKALDLEKNFEQAAFVLDLYYLSTRYPDAVDGVPFEQFNKKQADEALKYAEEIVLRVKEEFIG